MKGLTVMTFVLVIILSFSGCSNGRSITSPALEREVLNFPPQSIEIFGQASAGEFEGYFHDVDITNVQSIPWWQQAPGAGDKQNEAGGRTCLSPIML